MTTVPESLRSITDRYDQNHLLQWWDELSEPEQARLAEQIHAVDFDTIQSVHSANRNKQPQSNEAQTCRADRATAPKSVVFRDSSPDVAEQRRQEKEHGQKLLADGKVAVLTVAGGQGSRLGFDKPKGMFPIGPVTDRTLFQIFAEQILARRRRHGGALPWLIMTSAATHADTVDFFVDHDYFGLGDGTVHFFQQGSMPAVDAQTGRLLMDSKASLCLSPDGHGGLVTALATSGLLQRMADEGVEHFFYHQVDNPTIILCNPTLVGVHALQDSDVTTNVVRKAFPTEKVGVVVDLDGRSQIIEYSELNEEQAERVDENGNLVFWAGSIGIHVFRRAFMESLITDGCQLELHLASKKVPHLDDSGNLVTPPEPNANKFERFIFDALPLAETALIVECDREREFNPVKNPTGVDSVESARDALNRIGREWLRAAGQTVDDTRKVEISSSVALDVEELAARLERGDVTIDQLCG